MADEISINDLVQRAITARRHAIAPHSGFRVGAAIRSSDGSIYAGCNIENATLGLTTCAERVALLKALSEGVRDFTDLAIAVDAPKLAAPCGACRQLLWEYCGDISIILSGNEGARRLYKLSKLFPDPFDRSNLKTDLSFT